MAAAALKLEPKQNTQSEAFIARIIKEYGPGTAPAEFIARAIAETMWRLEMCRRMEDEILALSPNPFLDEDSAVARKLERLERYRSSIERAYHRYVKEWRNLIHDDVREKKTQSEEAILAEQLKFEELSTRRFFESTDRKIAHLAGLQKTELNL